MQSQLEQEVDKTKTITDLLKKYNYLQQDDMSVLKQILEQFDYYEEIYNMFEYSDGMLDGAIKSVQDILDPWQASMIYNMLNLLKQKVVQDTARTVDEKKILLRDWWLRMLDVVIAVARKETKKTTFIDRIQGQVDSLKSQVKD